MDWDRSVHTGHNSASLSDCQGPSALCGLRVLGLMCHDDKVKLPVATSCKTFLDGRMDSQLRFSFLFRTHQKHRDGHCNGARQLFSRPHAERYLKKSQSVGWTFRAGQGSDNSEPPGLRALRPYGTIFGRPYWTTLGLSIRLPTIILNLAGRDITEYSSPPP